MIKEGARQPERIASLDAMRGFAVMGILAMNIVAFAMPEMAYVSPKAFGGETGADIAAWAAGFLLFDGKMRGLFSILFGASMVLIAERAEAAGQDMKTVHYRRMAWLALFGYAHFLFIWWGDILFLYAVAGSLAFGFRSWDARRLIRWAIGIFALGVLLNSLFFGTQLTVAGMADSPSSSWAEAGRDIRAEYAKIDDEVVEELALFQGSYLTIVSERLANAAFPLFGVALTLLETLPMMLLGMALYRNGFLTGFWDSAAYRRVAATWLVPGLIWTSLIAWIQWRSGFDYLVGVNAFMAWAGPGRLMMTLAYAALLLLLARRIAGTPVFARVTAAGRAAFTNYLGTSIVMTTIFYGYGAGLFGALDRWTLYLVCIAMWALMLAWSKPWLDRFNYGPFEWLWRSLARGALQPLRRTKTRQ